MLACHARWQDKEGKKKNYPIPIFSKQCVVDSEERICGPLKASEAYILRSHAFKQGLISIYLTIYLYTRIRTYSSTRESSFLRSTPTLPV